MRRSMLLNIGLFCFCLLAEMISGKTVVANTDRRIFNGDRVTVISPGEGEVKRQPHIVRHEAVINTGRNVHYIKIKSVLVN